MNMQVKESKFTGNPHDFGRFKNKIITGLRVVNGYNITLGKEEPPVEPAEITAGSNAAAVAAYNAAKDRYDKSQASYDKRTGLAYGVITDHICDDILTAFEKTEGDPEKAYKLFLKFGPVENSDADEIYWFNFLKALKMGHCDYFDAFISRFDDAKEKSKTRDAPSTQLLRDAMPDRLAVEVRHTSMNSMNYEDTKKFLRNEDSSWHAKNPSPVDPTKKEDRKTINRVGKGRESKSCEKDEDSDTDEPEKQEFHPDVVCFNCNNNGHYASECKAKYCGKCGTAGHRSDKCKKKKSKARRIVKMGARDEDSEVEEFEDSDDDYINY